MQVKDNLTCLGTIVEYGPVVILYAVLLGHLGADTEEFSGQPLIGFGDIDWPGAMFFGNDQEMNGGLG